jgi:insertion element IS1 protein InsB
MTTSRSADDYLPLVKKLKEKYHTSIAASDYYAVYGVHLFADKHIMIKAETSLRESKNSLTRHYLARFNRKTKRYSKAVDMKFYPAIIQQE